MHIKNELLTGTWQLELLEDLVDGKWQKTFGEHPKGYFSFGPEGWLSIQFQEDLTATAETPKYIAYFGTYSVNAEERTFSTHVEGSVDTKIIGTKQTRPFEVKGDLLIVGDQKTYRRFLRKIK